MLKAETTQEIDNHVLVPDIFSAAVRFMVDWEGLPGNDETTEEIALLCHGVNSDHAKKCIPA